MNLGISSFVGDVLFLEIFKNVLHLISTDSPIFHFNNVSKYWFFISSSVLNGAFQPKAIHFPLIR